MILLGFFLIGCGLVLILRAAVTWRHPPAERREREPPAPAPYRPGETGRAILRTMRAVNDVRAISRGPGAYGKRLVRRSVFRSIRRW